MQLRDSLTLAVSTLLCLAGAEFVLRMAPVADPYQRFKQYDEFRPIRSMHKQDFRLVTEPEPGLPGMSGKATFSTNNAGFRGGPIHSVKPKGEFRIFLVGGSTIESLYIDDTQSPDRLLEDILNRHAPPDTVFRVFNAGFSGHRSTDHVAMIAHKIARYSPDMIIAFTGFNDVMESAKGYRPENGPKVHSASQLLRFAATDLQLGRRLFLLLKRREVAGTEDAMQLVTRVSNYAKNVKLCQALEVSERRPNVDTERYATNLRSIAALSQAHGAKPLFVTQQTTWNSKTEPKASAHNWMLCLKDTRYREDYMDEAMQAFNQVTIETGKAIDVPVVPFHEAAPKSLAIFYDDVHLNYNGCHLFADTVARFLLERKLTPATVVERINSD